MSRTSRYTPHRLPAASILLGLALSLAAVAQEKGDTLKIIYAPEVVVTAESILSRVAASAQPLAIINRAQIESSNAQDVSDVIGFTPGVFVKQYGGLGGLRTVS